MKYSYLLLTSLMSLALVFSCEKPEVVEPEEPGTEQETPDTTSKEEPVKPEPEVPVGTFSFKVAFDATNTAKDGWKTSWKPGDAINVFTIVGGRHDDAERWTNHGKFAFDHTAEADNTFVGDLAAELEDGTNYLWHAVYPYTVAFVDPSGLEEPHDDQMITLGHLPGGYLIQNGNDNMDHLTGPTFPLYDAANTAGNAAPEFEMHHMAAVVAVNVTNGTSAPLTVTDVKLAHKEIELVGDFAVDFGWVTGGFGSSMLFRSPKNASPESVLKVMSASAIPVGSSAKFYLPIMPNKFPAGGEWTLTVNDFKKSFPITTEQEIKSGKIHTFDLTVVDPASIKLSLPADNASIDAAAVDKVEFSWEKLEDEDEYSILFSAASDMADYRSVNAKAGDGHIMSAEDFDYYLHELGLDYLESGKIYWTVIIKGDHRLNSPVRALNVSRRAKVPYEERVADPITVPIAIVLEDPIYNGRLEQYRGMRLTEIKHEGWGYKWNDPKVQMKEYERDMEAASHGVIQYEVKHVIEADRFFSYYSDKVGEKEYVSVDTLVNYYFRYNPTDPKDNRKYIDKLASYDYVGMMKYYGFDKMVDNGEIKEVWVYTHPASGMNESRLIGEGAFWCNSMGIDVPEATNKELCCVMFCNYERTTDLAMHSYAHRVESIMAQVYENKKGFEGVNYEKKDKIEQLTNWEKFSAYELIYKKYKEGYSHIGMCHWPANSQEDYGYYNTRYVMTYADTWYDYPYIKEDDSVARKINRSEWQHVGDYQWGYMLWYHGHLPHFKGICPRDGHLNNWWHYLVDYNGAMRYEAELKSAR